MTHSRRAPAIVALLVAVCSGVAYWRTAYPTITWWDSSNYTLAATTLGLTNAPGSLLLTILGWVTTRFANPLQAAHTLNLLAAVLAAVAAALVVIVAVRVHRLIAASPEASDVGVAVGAGLGALAFAFSVTLWEHAVKFTPYVLTVVFTGLILLTLVRWWEGADRPDSWRWLVLLTFLFGLDFSVHRTNALLIPAALSWILARRPRTLVESRAWSGALAGMAAGLSFQLLVMPISSITASPLNMFQPDSWARFWDYVSLAQTGGNFQLGLWPRKSPLWTNQVADLLRVFSANFAHSASAVGIAGWLPLMAGAGGIAMLWRRVPRLALAFSMLWLLQAGATVLYFNIPAQYFRSLDRHYLPVLMTFAVAIALGAGMASQQIAAFWKRKPVVAAGVAAVVLGLPATQLIGNWTANDASRRFFTRDYAVNTLHGLPQNAFFFTVGDNDTFPLMYVQTVERVRPDVRIVNLSLANTDWYINQIRSRDPSFPVSGTPDQRRAENAPIWKDSILVIRRTDPRETELAPVALRQDSVVFRPTPSIGGQLLPADDVFLDVVQAADLRTPVAVSLTAGNSGLSWLRPYARVDGLHWRFVPVNNPPPDAALLRENLLRRYVYRGYADSTVVIEDVTRVMGALYRDSFKALIEAERAIGNVAECRSIAARADSLLPPARLSPATTPSPRLDASCGG